MILELKLKAEIIREKNKLDKEQKNKLNKPYYPGTRLRTVGKRRWGDWEELVSEKREKCIRRQSVSTNFAKDCRGFCNSFLKGVSK